VAVVAVMYSTTRPANDPPGGRVVVLSGEERSKATGTAVG
jgi:hypothetical protein